MSVRVALRQVQACCLDEEDKSQLGVPSAVGKPPGGKTGMTPLRGGKVGITIAPFLGETGGRKRGGPPIPFWGEGRPLGGAGIGG